MMEEKEKALQSGNLTRPSKKLDKFTQNILQLKIYVQNAPYIALLEQPKICAQFHLHYLKVIFQSEYRSRFYNRLNSTIETTAMVSKATGIPEKYLCQCKAYYEQRDMLKVLYLDRCRATGSTDVQYLSTNPKDWDNPDSLPKQTQLKLF